MWGANIIFSIILCLLQNAEGVSRVDPVVDIKLGKIRGLAATDGDYSMFLGIPYATVDALNPFGPSIPHLGFEDTFNAFSDAAMCPQIEEFNNTVTGTLDCLNINVYVPNTASSDRRRLPVLAWIYGGGFSIGFAGRYVHGPKYLVRHDVILVTFNYRLGAYGFMCLDTPEVPGNQGLKDQVLALRWIKDNIEAFGGDSNQVTIFGESAGGASVDIHFLYNQQENLFKNIILQSGTTFSPSSVTKADKSVPLLLAKRLGFVTDDIDEALSFLSSANTDNIVKATSEIRKFLKPCVEKQFDNVERLIHDYPRNVRSFDYKAVSILIGFNAQERLGFYLRKAPEDFKKLNVFHDTLRQYFNFESEYLVDMEKSVRRFYIGDEEITENVKWNLIDFSSDISAVYPTYKTIQKYLSGGANKIYHYVFSYGGGRNFVKRRLNINEGTATHADDIGYLFDVEFMKDIPSSEDQQMIDRMTTLWTNFAKYSDPTPETTDLLPVKWPAVTDDTLNCLNIGLDMFVYKRPYHERLAFWDLFYKLNDKYRIGYKEN